MKKIILLFFLFPIYVLGQFKSEANLTEADAPDYLKISGYGYDITRKEEMGLVKWSGSDGNSYGKEFMSYYFWPENMGIAMATKTKILKSKPNVNDWISSLTNNMIVVDRSSNSISAMDDRDPEKVQFSRLLVRADNPYYGNNYAWYDSTTTHYKHIDLNELGFKADGKFISFMSVDTYDLDDITVTFFMDYSSYLLGLAKKYAKEGNNSLLQAVKNSVINQNQKKTIMFQNLEEERTLAVSLGKDNDSEIKIIVDPEKWRSTSNVKRLYVMYHELGHDVFNFNHGNGGKMMYNYIDKDINWKDFMSDRIKLFDKNVARNLENLQLKDQPDLKKKSDNKTSQIADLLGQLYIEAVNSYKEKEFLSLMKKLTLK